MFLNVTLKKNIDLIKATFFLHQKGKVLPDTYIIDVDTFLNNAKKLLEEANNKDIKLYFMLKQLGRNPYLAKELVKLGYSGAVVVDYKEALVMIKNNIPIGNVGHLVQIPKAILKKIVAYMPEIITVYSFEKIIEIDNVAKELNLKQNIMLKVYDDKDIMYSGQLAGFHLNTLESLVKEIKSKCSNIKIKGITSFPCFLYNYDKRDITPTNNLETIKKAIKILQNNNIKIDIVNTPSATCCNTISKIKNNGGNCGEPGHGLTGTTPMHAFYNLEEIPCVIYLSEISHNFKENSYCYGGGHYRRSHIEKALVGKCIEDSKIVKVTPPKDESIDYYFGINEQCCISSTVIMAFRFQIFVTRSDIALVKGIASGNFNIIGIYDSQGRKKEQI